MAIAGRHIRWDWQTFVEWDQKSVRSLCGVTTRKHLAGIPGVTPQPQYVMVGDKSMAGWCLRCLRPFMTTMNRVDNMHDELDPRINDLYVAAYRTTELLTGYLVAKAKR